MLHREENTIRQGFLKRVHHNTLYHKTGFLSNLGRKRMHARLRSISVFSFTFFVCTVYATLAFHSVYADSGASETTRDDSSWSLEAGIGYLLPLAHTGEQWHPCVVPGFTVELPTGFQPVRLGLRLTGGVFQSRFRPRREVYLVHQSLHCKWRFSPKRVAVTGALSAGMSNAMVFTQLREGLESAQFFKPSENEFGVTSGIEAGIHRGRVRFSLPLEFNFTFSSPFPMTCFVVGLFGGIEL